MSFLVKLGAIEGVALRMFISHSCCISTLPSYPKSRTQANGEGALEHCDHHGRGRGKAQVHVGFYSSHSDVIHITSTLIIQRKSHAPHPTSQSYYIPGTENGVRIFCERTDEHRSGGVKLSL